MRPHTLCTGVLLAGQAFGTAVHAQAHGDLATRSLAATCAACHGTDGRAVEGAAMTRLGGLDRAYLQAQLLAFREGTRPATVMHQIAKGYTPEQIERLSGYFAAMPKVAP